MRFKVQKKNSPSKKTIQGLFSLLHYNNYEKITQKNLGDKCYGCAG